MKNASIAGAGNCVHPRAASLLPATVAFGSQPHCSSGHQADSWARKAAEKQGEGGAEKCLHVSAPSMRNANV
jgi:hypothetical protein